MYPGERSFKEGNIGLRGRLSQLTVSLFKHEGQSLGPQHPQRHFRVFPGPSLAALVSSRFREKVDLKKIRRLKKTPTLDFWP